ncbi:MAG: hypothetical protein OEW68_09455 [Gammaproteobacteria bacterium]|nr:hypothetical protein [Gammaproteobacteria bacterium]MDH4315054.1 hypothetical protein [Gammaproteobacteria bacterium]MDH5214039.1 hypothetical protein [Gammaproteobacteria bacterium]MDH5499746.1 hypothetical protein [Gammaproteobacteria bacterium]
MKGSKYQRVSIASMLILWVGSIALAAPEPLDADIAWAATGEFCEPETVLPLPDDTLLVSNVCGFREPGSGFLTLLDASGETLHWRVVEDLDAPTGMALNGDRLHVIDNNRLKVFRWPGYELLETVDLETVVANDLAISADGTVYVSDSAQHRVVRVMPDRAQSIFAGDSQFRNANGMAVRGEHLYVGGERLWRVSLTDLTVTTIGPEWLTDIDGIEFEANGILQVTPVGGSLVRYCNDELVEILAGDGISSANHGYSETLKLALIPTGFDNSVISIRLPGEFGGSSAPPSRCAF